VTVAGELAEPVEDEVESSAGDEVESSAEDVDVLESSLDDEVVSSVVLGVGADVVAVDTMAACCPEAAVVVPIGPTNAITPKASANVAAAVAAIRRRISEMRRRRASRRALAISIGDSGVSGGGEVWDMQPS
jgi:hypothetical protein